MKILAASLLALSAVFHLSAPVAAQEASSYVVIVHPDNPAKSVSKKRVSLLLLKEISSWEGGLSAQPVDLASTSQTRAAFSKDVHGRSVSSIKNYWQRQITSGGRVPPIELANDSAVINFVKSSRGAIGYVSANANLDGVKILDLASH